VYLVLISVGPFFVGYYLLDTQERLTLAIAISLIGIAGSGVAALTSCLDRYANGFELENGEKIPKEAKDKQTFNLRMSRWFIFRPFLGLLVAPVFLWGLTLLVKEPTAFTSSIERLGFTSFLAGLLAKSVIDLIKNLFKNIFKA
jgi:hypothetical protein